MSIISRGLNACRFISFSQSLTRCLSTVTASRKIPITPPSPAISLIPNSVKINWIYEEQDKIQTPFVNPYSSIQLPNGLVYVPVEEIPTDSKLEIVEAPLEVPKEEKHAARLIVIRRKKMKKHKLKKLRKRMKYEWAKLRQKREMKKEKEFQAKLIAQYKEAEKFSAEQYVEERLAKLHEVVIPEEWKRLPEDVLKWKMEKEKHLLK